MVFRQAGSLTVHERCVSEDLPSALVLKKILSGSCHCGIAQKILFKYYNKTFARILRVTPRVALSGEGAPVPVFFPISREGSLMDFLKECDLSSEANRSRSFYEAGSLMVHER